MSLLLGHHYWRVTLKCGSSAKLGHLIRPNHARHAQRYLDPVEASDAVVLFACVLTWQRTSVAAWALVATQGSILGEECPSFFPLLLPEPARR